MEYSLEEMLPLVRRLTEKYTSKESTSVSYETAEQLMGAILYCVREYEETLHYEVALGDGGASAVLAYESGLRIVKDKVRRAKSIYDGFMEDFNSYGNRVYQETVVEGIPSFFLYYDVLFSPQDHLLTLDYPVSHPWQDKAGIDAVEHFLWDVAMEQEFLSRLPFSYVTDVLAYAHPDYQEMLFNLGEAVLWNLLGHLLIGKWAGTSQFAEDDLAAIAVLAGELSEEELEARFQGLIVGLEARGWPGKGDLTAYLKDNCREFAFRLHKAADSKDVEGVFTMRGQI